MSAFCNGTLTERFDVAQCIELRARGHSLALCRFCVGMAVAKACAVVERPLSDGDLRSLYETTVRSKDWRS
jgi:hypothetical protein